VGEVGRGVLYFDRQTHLPIRAEWHDRPRGGGEGELREVDAYTQMRLNVGLGDADFAY
jgi:hypothetical protein